MYTQFERWLRGKPDTFLTVGLVAVAVLLLLIAFRAPPIVKAAALAWAVFP